MSQLSPCILHILYDDCVIDPACLKIVDIVSGEPCGVNQPGEMLIHTPSIMKGILDMPDATAAVIDADGFLHTGSIITICMLYLCFVFTIV